MASGKPSGGEPRGPARRELSRATAWAVPALVSLAPPAAAGQIAQALGTSFPVVQGVLKRLARAAGRGRSRFEAELDISMPLPSSETPSKSKNPARPGRAVTEPAGRAEPAPARPGMSRGHSEVLVFPPWAVKK